MAITHATAFLKSTSRYRRRVVKILSIVMIGFALTHCAKQEPPLWSDTQRALLRSLSLSSLTPPPTPYSNRVAEDSRAVALGKSLFFDKRLSAANDFSCATCHQPQRQFTDQLALGKGVNPLSRNTPSIIGGAWQTWFYWDGRRDSLWSQALIPIEAPDEMGGSRSGAVRLITQDKSYLKQYTALFGPLPPVLASERLPAHAGEFTDAKGKDAWYRLPKSTQKSINSAYANIGKVIAAFERTLIPKPSAFDRYVETLDNKGEEAARNILNASAINGAKLFIDVEKTRCLQCHNGPLLTNGDFHNVGTGNMRGDATAPGQALDFGRIFGVQAVLLDQFNCLGSYSDANQKQCSALRFLSREQHGDSAGAFKTPSLRNVAQTAPYFHDGQFETLEDVMQHYNTPTVDGVNELVALNLDDQELKDLVAFMSALNSPAYTEFEDNLDQEKTATKGWSDSEKALLSTLALSRLGPPPQDPGNAVFNSEEAAQLGEALFNDPGLSANRKISCSSCHQKNAGLGDGRATAVGLAPLSRNAPGLIGVAWRGNYYWDGRKDSLWSQALEPIETPNEMGANRFDVVAYVLNDPGLSQLYLRAFSSISPEIVKQLGNADARQQENNAIVDGVFSNLGKALASYERTFAFAPTRFDHWVDSLLKNDGRKLDLLTDKEQAGLRHFISGNTLCVTCHNGPRFSDGLFHNIGTGDGDRGRAAGIKALVADPFNCHSRFNDPAVSKDCAHLEAVNNVEVTALLDGAFRTPGLRELTRTGPYMHDGRFDTLEAVLEYYANPADKQNVFHELVPVNTLDATTIDELTTFLKVLSDTSSAQN